MGRLTSAYLVETVERALFVGGHDVQDDTLLSDSTPAISRPGHSGLLESLATLTHEISSLSSNISSTLPFQNTENRKRKRNDDACETRDFGPANTSDDDCSTCPVITDNLEGLLQAYFSHVQPWIPMIHEATFRSRLQTPDGRQSFAAVLQAINVAALRYVKTSTHEPLSKTHVAAETKKSRRHVILHAMDSMSVENLQALIIIAYTDVSSDSVGLAQTLADYPESWAMAVLTKPGRSLAHLQEQLSIFSYRSKQAIVMLE